jgi:hypothetical protein
MNNLAACLGGSAYQRVRAAVAISLCCIGIACREAAPNPSAETTKAIGLQQPLTSFRQILTSSRTDLTLRRAQDTHVPVKIQNPGTETWESAGQYPVNISYKWYKDGQMMGIEGERTLLPSPIGPNQVVDAEVHVIAPPDPGKYALRLTLVQEAVAWFMIRSNTFLELPVTIQ